MDHAQGVPLEKTDRTVLQPLSDQFVNRMGQALGEIIANVPGSYRSELERFMAQSRRSDGSNTAASSKTKPRSSLYSILWGWQVDNIGRAFTQRYLNIDDDAPWSIRDFESKCRTLT